MFNDQNKITLAIKEYAEGFCCFCFEFFPFPFSVIVSDFDIRTSTLIFSNPVYPMMHAFAWMLLMKALSRTNNFFQ